MEMTIPLHLISEIKKGRCVLFAGAATSQSPYSSLKGFMSSAALSGVLANECGYCEYCRHSQGSYCPQFSERGICNVPLGITSAFYISCFDRRTLVSKLAEIYNDRTIEPLPVHREMVKMPFKAIFTTNYDQLIERAFEATRRFVPILRNEDVAFVDDSSDCVYIYKLHGCTCYAKDSIVITYEDLDNAIRKKELLFNDLKGMMQRYTVLFIGHSFEDPNLLRLNQEILKQLGEVKPTLFILQRELSSSIKRRLQNLQARLLQGDLTSFIIELSHKLELGDKSG